MIFRYIELLASTGITLIDIGSSGSLDERWTRIAELVNLVGFDPNVSECERQNSEDYGYRSAIFLPYALHGYNGTSTLYKTRNIYCYSLLRPNTEWLSRFSFADFFEIEQEESINVRTIGAVRELVSIRPDILKIDVQGLELPILSQAESLLRETFYVETESGFTRNYNGETVFHELASFMEENHFLMFDINTDHRIPRNNVFKNHKTGREQILWAESVWLKDYVGLDRIGRFDELWLSPDKVRRILVICAVQGCLDYGLELAEFFNHKSLLPNIELEHLKNPSAWALENNSPAPTLEREPKELKVSKKVRLIANLARMLPLKYRVGLQKALASIHEERGR